jgi:hypothetical protein
MVPGRAGYARSASDEDALRSFSLYVSDVTGLKAKEVYGYVDEYFWVMSGVASALTLMEKPCLMESWNEGITMKDGEPFMNKLLEQFPVDEYAKSRHKLQVGLMMAVSSGDSEGAENIMGKIKLAKDPQYYLRIISPEAED